MAFHFGATIPELLDLVRVVKRCKVSLNKETYDVLIEAAWYHRMYQNNSEKLKFQEILTLWLSYFLENIKNRVWNWTCPFLSISDTCCFLMVLYSLYGLIY
jgi:hypothetical protein